MIIQLKHFPSLKLYFSLYFKIFTYGLVQWYLSKCARIPPSSAGGMNGLPSPLGERVRVRGK
jgi:hypothetical protein